MASAGQPAVGMLLDENAAAGADASTDADPILDALPIGELIG
ncbi:hypothetical protein [Paenibacillus koleovorans]|nr:hypothetical protein [Paenibacillus koleovorans]